MPAESPGGERSPTRKGIARQTAAVLGQEVEDALQEIVRAWFPRTLDEQYGGFLCDFNHRWRPAGPQLKMLEYQARMTRFAARVAAQPGFESCRHAAAHGFRYLKDAMWDRESGGWFRMLDRAGAPLEEFTKHGHGSSYAIGACTAYYELTCDPDALRLAQEGYAWLDKVAHDSVHGGYYPFYRRDGTRIVEARQNPLGGAFRDTMGVPIGLKDENTNADMMEACADLYKISPDEQLKQRLLEMLHIVRDRTVVPPGAVHMYLQPDWTPVPDFYRYPYAINTANLLAKVARILEPDAKTDAVIKSLIDTVVRYSWDNKKGGFYYAGSTFGAMYVEDIRVFIEDKFWWPQAEGTRALLRLALLYPDDAMNYFEHFLKLWNYIKRYLIDRKYGGWVWVGRDYFRFRRRPKATKWKDPSHEGHSLLECLRLLKEHASVDRSYVESR
jgi:cellobiose epimerase